VEFNRCIIGDCRDALPDLITKGARVQMCVTSPPYWGLRDYGHPRQIGLEPTVQEYVDTMVGVFRLVHDLLADDGTVWLNIGDCYANDGKWGGETGGKQHYLGEINRKRVGREKRSTGLKPKDLVMMPARIAMALQADGWWVRQDIIWHKPNPMPESVRDRCTKAHEYLFLLSKQERYYFDAEAIKEEASDNGRINGVNGRDEDERARPPMTSPRTLARLDYSTPGRNKRSVWTIPISAFAEAHFAVMPRALVEPCILAGSRVGDIVLDPFFGSGTVGEVAQRLGRKWIGIDLQKDYAPLQDRRTAQQGFEL
jgi:DNA modification methylase